MPQGFAEQDVKVGVQECRRPDVAARGRLQLAAQVLLDPLDTLLVESPGEVFDDKGFESDADVEEIDDLLQRKLTDDDALLRRDRDEALVGQAFRARERTGVLLMPRRAANCRSERKVPGMNVQSKMSCLSSS